MFKRWRRRQDHERAKKRRREEGLKIDNSILSYDKLGTIKRQE